MMTLEEAYRFGQMSLNQAGIPDAGTDAWILL